MKKKIQGTDKKEKRIALVGNPNVGKSTLFNSLTGLHQHTGNWSGKTVGSAYGSAKSEKYDYTLIDLPGTYSLTPHSYEEELTRDFLMFEEYDAVIVVCDCARIERNLFLLLEVMRVTKNVVLCLNLCKEGERSGIYIDNDILSSFLGIPVLFTDAKSKKSTKRVLSFLDLLEENKQMPIEIPKDNTSLLSLAEEIYSLAVKEGENKQRMQSRKIDSILTGRISAFPFMLLFLFFILMITVSGANIISSFLSDILFSFEAPLLSFLYSIGLPNFCSLAISQGVYRMLAWVVSVMLPPMAIFFPLFTLLEDTGYLPRIAYNLDKPFMRCSACGKQSLTMCMGLGCNSAGVVGCRIIDSPRERLLAILTNSFIPCNGKIPALVSVISLFFALSLPPLISFGIISGIMAFLILISVLLTLLVTKILASTLLKGLPSSFVLEMPPYRAPKLGQVFVRSFIDRTLSVLWRAVCVAAPFGLIVFLLANINISEETALSFLASVLDPIGNILGLDGIILLSFMLGICANETVIPIMLTAYTQSSALGEGGETLTLALLEANGWTAKTAVCFIIIMLFHSPCSTTLLTIKKESGKLSYALLSALLPSLCGIIICIAVNLFSSLFFK